MTPQQTKPTYADELRAARDLIDGPEKWAWRKAEDGPRRCAFRALNDADVSFPARHFVYGVLEEIGGVGLIAWNDQPGRTHAEVMDLLDRAIAAAEI